MDYLASHIFSFVLAIFIFTGILLYISRQEIKIYKRDLAIYEKGKTYSKRKTEKNIKYSGNVINFQKHRRNKIFKWRK